jgi:hypothetical protein
LENYVFQVKNSVNDEKVAGQVSESDKKKVLDAVNSTTQWLDSNQSAEKEEFEEKQKALETIVLPILQNLSGGAGGAPGTIYFICIIYFFLIVFLKADFLEDFLVGPLVDSKRLPLMHMMMDLSLYFCVWFNR